MKFLAVLRIALHSLERHKMRSILTMLGIVIGIAAVVTSVSFGEGANQLVQAQIANMGTNLLYAFAGSMGRGGVRQGLGSMSTLSVEDAQAIARECSAVKIVSAGVGGERAGGIWRPELVYRAEWSGRAVQDHPELADGLGDFF